VIACNTSADQFVVLSATLDTPNPLGFNYQTKYENIDDMRTNASATLNVNEAKLLSMFAQIELLQLMSPSDGSSLFYKVLTANGLTYFSIYFDRKAPINRCNNSRSCPERF
jgi:hypothetical protein